jgi:hypothetical protein
METSDFHHPARDAPAVASPGLQALLELQVQSSLYPTQDLRRGCGVDQGDGAFGELSVFVANFSSWAFTFLNAPFRSIRGMLAHQGGEDRPGPPSWQNHAKDMWACDALAGHRPLLSLTGRPSSLSMCTLRESFLWVSTHLLVLLPTPGPPGPLREATPYGRSPNSLIRDRDHKFGSCARSRGCNQRHQGDHYALPCATSQCDL